MIKWIIIILMVLVIVEVADAVFLVPDRGWALTGADAQNADSEWTHVLEACIRDGTDAQNCIRIDSVGGNNNDFQMKITSDTDPATISTLEIRLFTNSNSGNDDVTIQAYDTESTITTSNSVTLTLVQGSFATADISAMLGNFDANGVNWTVRVMAVGNGNDEIGEVEVQETLSGDTIPPVVNATLNKSLTNIRINDIINLTANATDETGLSFGQIIVNDTGFNRIFNFSLGDATTATFSQNITITDEFAVINFTARVNDTSNNFDMNDTIITVVDDIIPIFTGNSTNLTAPFINNTVGFSINVSDDVGLSLVKFAWNGTVGAEIGNLSGDRNDAVLPYINTSGLVLLMHFNNESAFGEATETTSAGDNYTVDFSVDINTERTGARNNGSFFGGATINKTNFRLGGGALELDGVDDNVGINSDLGINTYPFTMSAWVTMDSLHSSGANGFVGIFDNTVGNRIYGIEARSTDKASIYAIDGGSFFSAQGTTNILNTGWHHIVGVFISDTEKLLYVNGVQEANLTSSTVFQSSTNVVDIGRHGDSSPTAYHDGTIDEVAIWNRSLSAEEIKELFARGNNGSLTNITDTGFLSGTSSLNWTANRSVVREGVVGWQFWVNDTSGNVAQTSIFNFTVTAIVEAADVVLPTFDNSATNATTPVADTTIQINGTCSDDVSLSSMWFATNESSDGELLNKTSTNFTATTTSSTFIVNDTSVEGFIIAQFTCNDTSGNVVQSIRGQVIENHGWNFLYNVTVNNNYSVNWENQSIRINLARDLSGFNNSDWSNGSNIRVRDNQNNTLKSFIDYWRYQNNDTVIWFNSTIPANSNVTYSIYFNGTGIDPLNDHGFMSIFENFTAGGTPAGWATNGVFTFSNDNVPGGPLTPPFNLQITTNSDNNWVSPPLPPNDQDVGIGNYTLDFYYFSTTSTDNAFLFMGDGFWRWEAGSTPLAWPRTDFWGCTNRTAEEGTKILIKPTDRWIRQKLVRERKITSIRKADNHSMGIFYINQSIYNQCNGTNAFFGTTQSRVGYSFSGGNGGGGVLRIDNFKMYRNFGWNTSEPYFGAISNKLTTGEFQISYIGSAAPVTDSCTYTSGDWDLDSTDNCVISSPVTGDAGSCFKLTGQGGSFIANALIKGFACYDFLSKAANIEFNKGRKTGT